MAEKQVTTMVIKVDLECEKCVKKIKKVLCKIPQIQNQIYDKKANTVTITVVCCSPDKIKQKICYKGGETIKGIEIKVPEKPKPPAKPKEPEKPIKVIPATGVHNDPEPGTKPGSLTLPQPRDPEFQSDFHRYGTPAALPCYVPAYGRPVYDSWGGGGCSCQRSGYYVCRCEYVCDDNRESCIIM